MSIELTGGTSYEQIGTSGSVTYPSAEWSIYFMFKPAALGLRGTQDYIYGHDTPSAANDAVNVAIVGTGGTGTANAIRVRVESAAVLMLIQNTSNVATVDQWNVFALSWTGSQFKLFLNGVETIFSPAATVTTLTPGNPIFIGQRDDLSSSRAYTGFAAHVAKYDRDFSSAAGVRATNSFLSPQFAQQDLQFHVEMWNASFNYDQQNQQTVTPVNGLLFGNHAPASYPSDPHEIPSSPAPPDIQSFSQVTFA